MPRSRRVGNGGIGRECTVGLRVFFRISEQRRSVFQKFVQKGASAIRLAVAALTSWKMPSSRLEYQILDDVAGIE
jgi:hypothetical protein